MLIRNKRPAWPTWSACLRPAAPGNESQHKIGNNLFSQMLISRCRNKAEARQGGHVGLTCHGAPLAQIPGWIAHPTPNAITQCYLKQIRHKGHSGGMFANTALSAGAVSNPQLHALHTDAPESICRR